MAKMGLELSSLLSAQDFLIRSNGDQVKVSSLMSGGKNTVVGLYFSASSSISCQDFTPTLLEAYRELSSKADFEVVLISSDKDDESFTEYFSKMPWLALPFSESELRATLKELFKVQRTPHLVLFDSHGRVACRSGVSIIRKYGAEAYPFTEAKLQFVTQQAEIAKLNQTLTTLLLSPTRDYLISNDGAKTDVVELEGKMVCLYVSMEALPSCAEFTPKLVDFYNGIKGKGVDDFEVVLVSLDSDEDKFRKGFETMPWLALPFKDRTCSKLLDYFQLRKIPTVIVIGPDGKTVSPNVVELIEEFGIEAYPFSPDKFAGFEEKKKAEAESQTLDKILVHGDKDFLVDKNGTMVPVGELVGKTVLLYFSANWCPPCRKFTPKLIQSYHEIKAAKDGNLEVVFLSRDEDEDHFNEYFSTMPWLAAPFNPEMRKGLQKKFRLAGIPALVAIGPSGRTLTTEGREALTVHGVDAYPFTEEHLRELDEKMDEAVKKRWPEKVRDDEVHEHELVRKKGEGYMCRGCEEIGGGWSYGCKPCDFSVHLECGLSVKEEAGKEGWVCDGDVCRKKA